MEREREREKQEASKIIIIIIINRFINSHFQRWIRQVHRFKNVQQESENVIGHRWLERRLEQVLAHGSRPWQKTRIRQERDQVSSKESLRRSRSRLGISRV